MISLNNRMRAIADFVRKDAVFADIGTDHAYIPIVLLQSGRCSFGYASDINEKPLMSAQKNLAHYGLLEKTELFISDGLKEYAGKNADDYIVAGMGGELITEILQKAPFSFLGKRFIFQPMSKIEMFRMFLIKNGFNIISEICVESENKNYIIIVCEYDGIEKQEERLFEYIGKLDLSLKESQNYLENKINSLRKKQIGFFTANKSEESKKLQNLIKMLEEKRNENI